MKIILAVDDSPGSEQAVNDRSCIMFGWVVQDKDKVVQDKNKR